MLNLTDSSYFVTPNQSIARIAVPALVYQSFDYVLDLNYSSAIKQIQPGTRALIELGRRQCIGIILELCEGSDTDSQKLKPVLAVDQTDNGLTTPLLKLLTWSAHYYCHPLGECLQAALPSALRHSILPPDIRIREWHYTGKTLALRANAHKQIALIETLQDASEGMTEAQLSSNGFTRKQLKDLESKGYLRACDVMIPRTQDAPGSAIREIQLTHQQTTALNALQTTETPPGFRVSLLHGITGSGKTEVYIKAVQTILDQGGQALIMIPEINLSPQTLERFQRSLDTPILLVHSGLSEKEKYRSWALAKNGEAKVVIGTRSAIFTPFESLQLIVVDEEHDSSYKQADGFKYSGRDLAVKRGQLEDCPVILGSATPSLETLYRAKEDHYHWIKMTQRAGAQPLPSVALIDIKSRELSHGCSRPLIQAITQELSQGNQVILFQNKRGFAPTLMCSACGTIVMCPRCDSRMTVHSQTRSLQCHHCDYQQALPSHCSECGSDQLKPIGVGTERLEFALENLFPEHKVIRIDRDSTRNARHMSEHIKQLNEQGPALLVGTQMLAKGHDFPAVTLVAIVDADGLFFSSDFRAIEKGAQLLTQVAGRAGRGERTGRVLIQTRLPEHPIFDYICAHNYLDCALEELEEREYCQLPPHSKMISLRAESRELGRSLNALQTIKQHIEQSLQTTRPSLSLPQFLGPSAAAISKKRHSFRAYLTIICSSNPTRARIQAMLPSLIKLPKSNQARVHIDVDPIEYL